MGEKRLQTRKPCMEQRSQHSFGIGRGSNALTSSFSNWNSGIILPVSIFLTSFSQRGHLQPPLRPQDF